MPPHDATVFVVDDHRGMRKSLCYLIESVGLNAEAYPSAEDFLDAYHPSRIGCLVLDVQMPGMTGLQLLEELAARGDCRPTIIITGHGDIPSAVRAMKAGAVDFLQKPFNDDDLLERIQQSVDLDAQWRKWHIEALDIAQRMATLSPREREVMDLVVAGHSSKEIAETLDLSPHTVESHRTHVMRKMGAHSAVELARMASLCRTTKGSPLQA